MKNFNFNNFNVKKFDLINRRTHLYLGMFLLPWFFLYGLSSLLISHHSWFRSGTPPQWTVLFDKEYSYPFEEGDDVRKTAEHILEEHNLTKSFFAPRPNKGILRINQSSFWKTTRLTYFMNEHRLLAEQRRFNFEQFLIGMHIRAGYQQPRLWNDIWAVTVDLVCIAILFWLASGIYMWWKIRKTRWWGALALGGGFVSFLFLLLGM